MEQGITIFSILTALGLATSTLVLALTGRSSGAAAASTPKPIPDPTPESGGVKLGVKSKLAALGRMLAWLREKALAALHH